MEVGHVTYSWNSREEEHTVKGGDHNKDNNNKNTMQVTIKYYPVKRGALPVL